MGGATKPRVMIGSGKINSIGENEYAGNFQVPPALLPRADEVIECSGASFS
jgi:hypothetical protein